MLDSEKIKQTNDNEDSREIVHNSHKERMLLAKEEKAFQGVIRSVYIMSNWTFFNNKIMIKFGTCQQTRHLGIPGF